MTTLSIREQKFVLAYTGLCQGNITQSAIQAGYSPQSAARSGHRLTKRAHVQQAIADRLGKLTSKLDISDERILTHLADVGFVRLPEDKIDAKAKLKALELLANHKGLLHQDEAPSSRITVNIGFLGQLPGPTDVISVTAVTTPPHNPGHIPTLDHMPSSHTGASLSPGTEVSTGETTQNP